MKEFDTIIQASPRGVGFSFEVGMAYLGEIPLCSRREHCTISTSSL